MRFGDYFKDLEEKSSLVLDKKGWFVIRLDGKAFHTYTKGCQKPFDSGITMAFSNATKSLCQEIQNIKFAYLQSDEVSLFLNDEDQENTNLFFNGKVQKIVSVVASIFTAHFNRQYKHSSGKLAYFDARIFKLNGKEDVQKYLIWRQEDCYKNAITLISLKHFSPKQIHEKNTLDKIEMISSKGDDVSNYSNNHILGVLVKKEIKRVLAVNPKTKISEYTNRGFWVDLESIDFKQKSFEIIINND